MSRNTQELVATMQALHVYANLRAKRIDEQVILKAFTMVQVQCIANMTGSNELFKDKIYNDESEKLLNELVVQITDLIKSYISDILESTTK